MRNYSSILTPLLWVLFISPSIATPLDDLKACQLIKNKNSRTGCYDNKVESAIRYIEFIQDEKNERAQKSKNTEEARAIIMAFKKIGARVSTGVSYKEYPSLVGDLKYAVSIFIDTDYAKDNPQFRKIISDAMNDHENALMIWKWKFVGREVDDYLSCAMDGYKEICSHVINSYPNVPLKHYLENTRYAIPIDGAISHIWVIASRRITDADGQK